MTAFFVRLNPSTLVKSFSSRTEMQPPSTKMLTWPKSIVTVIRSWRCRILTCLSGPALPGSRLTVVPSSAERSIHFRMQCSSGLRILHRPIAVKAVARHRVSLLTR